MAEHDELKDDSIQKQIIQAAQQLFRLHGLQKVTMDDVAKEIGKRRSSLYYYYKNKEEILDAAIDVEMREIFMEIANAVDKAQGMEEKISVYYMTRLKISQKRKVFYNMIDSGMNTDELSDYKKIKMTMHSRFRKMEIPLLRQILDYGIEKKQLRTMTAKEQDTLIFILLSSMQGFKKELLIKKSVSAVEPAVKMLIDMVMRVFKK